MSRSSYRGYPQGKLYTAYTARVQSFMFYVSSDRFMVGTHSWPLFKEVFLEANTVLPVRSPFLTESRLRVVPNFGDFGELHARARKWDSREETCHEGRR